MTLVGGAVAGGREASILADGTSQLVKKQAVSGGIEMGVAADEILGHRDVRRLAKERRKAVDETHAARGCPVAPIPHLDAVAIARRATMRMRQAWPTTRIAFLTR